MSKSFYNVKNNSFLRTNIYLSSDIPLSNDFELAVSPSSTSTVFQNNQRISESIHSRKNASIISPTTQSKPQLPVLTNLAIEKTGRSRTHENLSGTERHKTESPAFNSPVKVSTALTARTTHIPAISSSKFKKTSIVDYSSLSPVQEFEEPVPDYIKASEKRVLTQMMLEKDRIQSITRGISKRDISYVNGSPTAVGGSIITSSLYDKANGSSPNSNPNIIRHLSTLKDSIDSQLISPKSQRDLISSRQSPKARTFFSSQLSNSNLGDRLNSEGGFRNQRISLESQSLSARERIELNHTGSIDKPQCAIKLIGDRPVAMSFKLDNDVKIKSNEIGLKESAVIPLLWMPSQAREGLSTAHKKGRSLKEDSLISELKKEAPHTFTEAPSSRKDVVVIGNWMEERIESIKKSEMKDIEKFAKYDQVYNVCLNELLRQVSFECAERGELLFRIWQAYFNVFGQYKNDLDSENERIKNDNQNEIKKSNEWLEEIVKTKDQEIERCKEVIARHTGERDAVQIKLDKANAKSYKNKEKISRLVAIVRKMKTHIKKLSLENEAFSKRRELQQEFGHKIGTKFVEGSVPSIRPVTPVRITGVLAKESEGLPVITLQVPGTLQLTEKPAESRDPNAEDVNSSDSSAESHNSSLDFVYQDMDKIDQVHKVDQLNKRVLAYRHSGVNYVQDYKEATDAEVQTHLFLLEDRYDMLLGNQRVLDEMLLEFKLRQDVDVLLDDNINVPNIDNLVGFNIQEKAFNQYYSTGHKRSIEDIVDGLMHQNTQKSDTADSEIKSTALVKAVSNPSIGIETTFLFLSL